MRIDTEIHIYTHTHTHTHAPHKRRCTHAYIHTYTHSYINTHTVLCTRAWTHTPHTTHHTPHTTHHTPHTTHHTPHTYTHHEHVSQVTCPCLLAWIILCNCVSLCLNANLHLFFVTIIWNIWVYARYNR